MPLDLVLEDTFICSATQLKVSSLSSDKDLSIAASSLTK